MAVLDTVRIVIRDNGTSQRYTDAELNVLIDLAINELNTWLDTTYTVTDYNATTVLVPLYQQNLLYLLCRIIVLQSDVLDPKRYIKFVTQDTEYDATDVGKNLQKMLDSLNKEFEFKLRKWYGVTFGGTLSCATEFTEITDNA